MGDALKIDFKLSLDYILSKKALVQHYCHVTHQ